MGALSEVISTTYTSNLNSATNVAVDLSRIRDILDICPPSFVDTDLRPTNRETATPSSADRQVPPQWVRLSRRPSVDQPDDSGSPVLDGDQNMPCGPSVTPLAAVNSTPFQGMAADHGLTSATNESAGFPADLFFNGISQDASSWWNAFDTYNPDGPSF